MPYTFDNPPDIIKKLPSGAQKVWITAFNGYLDKGFEESRAIKSAWGAVKQNWQQDPQGNWRRKSETTPPQEDLPEEIQNMWNKEYRQAVKDGNGKPTAEKMAWLAIQKKWKKMKNSWKAIKKRHETMLKNYKTLKEGTQIAYKTQEYKDGDILQLQFCCVGENIYDKELGEMITNFESGALGQTIGLHVDHPFFLNIQSDTRRYGDILNIYRKGTHEGWIEVRLNTLGAKTFNDRSYAYLSPGWWGEYEHRKTGEKVKNVPFEISMTNMPAEKMMEAIIAMAENEFPDKDKPGNKPEDEMPPDEDKPEDEPEKLAFPPGDKEPEEEEPIEAMLEKFKSYGGKIIDKLKNKSGNSMRRSKFKDFLSGLSISKKSEEEVKDMPDEDMVKTLAERNDQIKTLREDLDKAQGDMKKITEEKRSTERLTLAESYLPQPGSEAYRIKKEDLEETHEFLMTLDEKQVKSWKILMDKSPVMTVKMGVQGVGLVKEEPKAKEKANMLSENDFETKVRSESKKDPDWEIATKRGEIMAKARKELSEKFEIAKEE